MTCSDAFVKEYGVAPHDRVVRNPSMMHGAYACTGQWQGGVGRRGFLRASVGGLCRGRCKRETAGGEMVRSVGRRCGVAAPDV